MAIARINGPMLNSNLERQGVNLAIDANLMYFDVTDRFIGINNTTPGYALDSTGNARIANLFILGNTISSNTGVINFGNISNVSIYGGSSNYIVSTNGSGSLSFIDANTLPALSVINANIAGVDANITAINLAIANISANVSNVEGNIIPLGSNTSQAFVSNALTLTSSTSVTNAIAQLNYVLGKMVPPSPPNFPNATTITVTPSNTGLMCNFVQTDNSGWGNLSVSGGTSVNTVRAATMSTSGTPVTNVGPGNTGTVTAYINGVPNGNVTLTGNNSNTTNGNLYVYNVEDYHNVLSTVTAGFWSVFSTYATATSGMLPGWNRVHISDTGTGTQTNDAIWYYDASTPSTPAFSATSMVLSSNVVQYSSTIPMFTSSAGFTLKGNVTNLSGDTYYNSTNLFYMLTAGGAFAAPAQVTLASVGITTPMPRNSTAVAQFTTTSNIISGFGSATASGGPTIGVFNNYSEGTDVYTQGNIILYKTGTGNQIEETSLTIAAGVGSGSGNPFRIANPDAGTQTDNPAYTGSESAFNSTTGPFYATDATNVSSYVKYDVTNYSSGYLPVGPNLSTRVTTAQYFTFKFVRTAVSKFDIALTTNGGTAGIAGLWVALPGSTIDTTAAPTNGWVNMSTAYAGSGVPGTGTGGNGSSGCSTGGAVPLNTTISGGSYTCTFGTVSSSSSATNEIYVRVKLTSGQSLSALSIQVATH